MRTIRILATLLVICVSTSFAQTTSSPTVAFVYLGDRGTHKITAFSLQANGSAHPVPGSPFSSAALSNGFPATSLAASTNFVFATDSEHIATFRRSSNGALTFASVVDATVSDGADIVETLTLDRSASNLYAGSRVERQIFDKGAQGQLTAASEVTGDQSSGEFQFNHSNKFAYRTFQPFINLPELFSTNQGCTFEAYSRAADGSLNPFDPQLARPTGVAESDFCPGSVASSALGYVAVAYRTLGPPPALGSGVHSIAVYWILPSGELSLVSNFVTTLDALVPITLKFDPSGTFLAAAGTQGIQLYKLSSAGKLTKSGSGLYTHTYFRDVRWDNSGHVVTISFGAVYFFGLKNGQLVQTNSPISLLSLGGIRDIKIVSLQ